MPVPNNWASRYFLTSARNRSPKAMDWTPCALASRTISIISVSYSSLLQGSGSGTLISGRPAAAACASSTEL
jgi:hypothetical protein